MGLSEIQNKLLTVNRDGGVIRVETQDGLVFEELLDSVSVVRVEKDAWWLSWKPAWFTEGGGHNIHVTKIVKTEILESVRSKYDGEQWVELNLMNSERDKIHIEVILPVINKDRSEAWLKWKKYRNDNIDEYREIDEAVFKAHKRIAEEG